MVGYCLLRGSHVASFPGFPLGTGSERLAFCCSMTYTGTCRVDIQSCITMVCNFHWGQVLKGRHDCDDGMQLALISMPQLPYIMSGCGQATNGEKKDMN